MFWIYLKQVFWRWETIVSAAGTILWVSQSSGVAIPGKPWMFAVLVYGSLLWATYEVFREVVRLLPGRADIQIELASAHFGGHGWSRSPSQPTPPLRFLADAAISNRGAEAGRIARLHATHLADNVDFLRLTRRGATLKRGRNVLGLPMPIRAGEIASGFQLECEVEMTIPLLEFAQCVRDVDQFEVSLELEQIDLRGDRLSRPLVIRGTFASFRQEAIRQWRNDKEWALLKAIGGDEGDSKIEP